MRWLICGDQQSLFPAKEGPWRLSWKEISHGNDRGQYLGTYYCIFTLWFMKNISQTTHCCRKDKVVIILCIVISLFMNCPKYFVLVCIVICKFYFHRKGRYVKQCFNYIPNWSHTVLKVWPKCSSSSTMNQGNNYNGFRKAYCCRFYMLVV